MIEESIRFPYGVENTPEWIYDWVSAQPWNHALREGDYEIQRRLYQPGETWKRQYKQEFIKLAIDKHNVQVFVLIDDKLFIDIPVNEETTAFLLKYQQLASTKKS